LKIDHMVEMEGAFMCRKGHPLTQLAKVSLDQLLKYPVASTPLSDELTRILIERYGARAHPQVMVKLSSDEISQLIQVAKQSDTVVLAIRAASPELVQISMSPKLNARARFGLVTMTGRAESLYLPEIRRLMSEVLH